MHENSEINLYQEYLIFVYSNSGNVQELISCHNCHSNEICFSIITQKYK